MDFKNAEIKTFLENLASNSPAPGGGSASAVCGALAASLVSMVANLTVGKEKFTEQEHLMRQLVAETKELREKFLKLMQEDIDAFNLYMSALRMKKETELEKRARKAAMQDAIRLSTEVPLKMIDACVQTAELSLSAARCGNPGAVSDAGTAALMAEAAAKSASYNVYMNLPHVSAPELAGSYQIRMNEGLEKIAELVSEVSDILQKIFDATVNGE
ncbi:MAG: cyclodeaminase/cyclohydrolase family protein [Synergistaceae bacterium]|nr:cyclodeaminase/cyclohydrolase family protein [Synergistaceae bacterium]